MIRIISAKRLRQLEDDSLHVTAMGERLERLSREKAELTLKLRLITSELYSCKHAAEELEKVETSLSGLRKAAVTALARSGIVTPEYLSDSSLAMVLNHIPVPKLESKKPAPKKKKGKRK